MNRETREIELRLLAKSEAGRAKIQKLYKRALKIKVAPKPTRGKMLDMMIETILDHLYPLPRDDESVGETQTIVVKCPSCTKVFIAGDCEKKEPEAVKPSPEVRCPKCSNWVRVDQ